MRIFDIMVPDGEYTNRQGEQKPSLNSIGFVLVKDNGKMSAKLYHMPGVWCLLYERNRDRNRGGNVEQIGGAKEPDW